MPAATTRSGGDLLEAVHEAFGPERSFTTKQVISATMPYGNDTGVTIPEHVLPASILDKRSQAATAAKTLGRWFLNRKGRWADGAGGKYRAVFIHKDRAGTHWKVEKI